eukprot:TRINITY_DN1307_c0_g1_i11.p4 TRINITY_DN1307_c0_g1~~TRINITY_DN1307_c0_g1_i11.p4  ORF type:complete len:230 (+),score=-13.64 TRINITY_DN1307_c0_g1_i11:2402-3091(+)
MKSLHTQQQVRQLNIIYQQQICKCEVIFMRTLWQDRNKHTILLVANNRGFSNLVGLQNTIVSRQVLDMIFVSEYEPEQHRVHIVCILSTDNGVKQRSIIYLCVCTRRYLFVVHLILPYFNLRIVVHVCFSETIILFNIAKESNSLNTILYQISRDMDVYFSSFCHQVWYGTCYYKDTKVLYLYLERYRTTYTSTTKTQQTYESKQKQIPFLNNLFQKFIWGGGNGTLKY